MSGSVTASNSGKANANRVSGQQNTTTTVTQRQEVHVEQSQTVQINDQHGCAECTTATGKTQQLGTIVIYNGSHCQRKVTVGVTGKIALEGEQLEDATISMQTPPKTESRAGFVGSLTRLDAEAGDLDIQIMQRSEQTADYCPGENRIFRD